MGTVGDTVLDIIKLEHPPLKVLELLKEQVEGFDPVQWRDPTTGQSVLHYVTKAKRLKVVKLLLESGCDVNATDLKGRPPLYVACETGRLDIVKLLVAHGADIHGMKFKGTWQKVYCSSCKSCSKCTESVREVDDMTVLAWALERNQMEIVTYLLEQGTRADSTALAVAMGKQTQMLKVCHTHFRRDRQPGNADRRASCAMLCRHYWPQGRRGASIHRNTRKWFLEQPKRAAERSVVYISCGLHWA
jgi:hypothetical protein